MIFNDKLSPERRQFLHALFIPTIISIFIVLAFIVELGLDLDFHKAGIYPRDFSKILNVFTYIFVHSGWSHLINNITTFFVLTISLYFFYNQIANKILISIYILSGLILWVIGRESWHIGASGLIYALVFFLFFSGIIRNHIPLIAISLVVTFLYGNMIWHVFPWEVYDPISWEGHLSGLLSGVFLSLVFKKSGPQKPVKVWEEEDDSNLDDEMNNDKDSIEDADNENSKT